jgi:uncharacterized repeat protein (TIGR03806 family)
MKHFYLIFTLFLVSIVGITACSDDNQKPEEEEYEPIPPTPEPPTSPVVLDLSQVPYPKLSDYVFFEGQMKNQQPSLGVLPYDVNSHLFTDYALKKRFVWMPSGVKANYTEDGKILNFPVGAVLIKTFYYDNMQPSNTTKILETRLMIKKATGWIFAEYIWNDEQTEAFLDMEGSIKEISWKDEHDEIRVAEYRLPSAAECLTCHKSNELAIPIGPKPQTLNMSYTYADGTKNQLTKWVEMGYLDSNYPSNIVTTVNYEDTTQPLELRVRSYVDINCAHCHQEDSHCSYREVRFAFSETTDIMNMGICIPQGESVGGAFTYIITPSNVNRSALPFRLQSVNPTTRMPFLGRTIVHEEGLQLVKDWINTLNQTCE